MSGGDGLYWVTNPAGGHLARSTTVDGFIGAVLNNDTNKLMGQAILRKVPNPSSLNPLLITGLVLAGAVAGGVVAITFGRRQQLKLRQRSTPTIEVEPGAQPKQGKRLDPIILPAEFSSEIAAAVQEALAPMSRIEARSRLIMMLIASAFAAEQIRALNSAALADEPQLLELIDAMGLLSTSEVVALANKTLDADELELGEDSSQLLVSVFRGGRPVDGVYVPLTESDVTEALRLLPAESPLEPIAED